VLEVTGKQGARVAVVPAVRSRRRNSKRLYGRQVPLTGALLVAPAMVLIGGLFVLPLGLGAWMSLNNWPLLGGHSFVGLSNYRQLFDDGGFGRSLVFTAAFTAVIMPLVFLVGLGLALLVQHSRRGVGVVRAAIVAPVTIGFATASYLWLSLLDPSTGVVDRALVALHLVGHPVNWLNTAGLALLMVVMVTVWKLAGFAMVVLMNGLQGVPADVEEAAKVDGAKRWRVFWNIKLPLMRRSIVLAMVFVVLAGFLSFDQFYIMTGGAPNNSTITLVYRIYDTAFIQGNLGYAAAMSFAMLAVVLVITFVELALLPKKEVG
jgi:multiple sugar transport system permease protein